VDLISQAVQTNLETLERKSASEGNPFGVRRLRDSIQGQEVETKLDESSE
jgi:hypothetical protein